MRALGSKRDKRCIPSYRPSTLPSRRCSLPSTCSSATPPPRLAPPLPTAESPTSSLLSRKDGSLLPLLPPSLSEAVAPPLACATPLAPLVSSPTPHSLPRESSPHSASSPSVPGINSPPSAMMSPRFQSLAAARIRPTSPTTLPTCQMTPRHPDLALILLIRMDLLVLFLLLLLINLSTTQQGKRILHCQASLFRKTSLF